MQNIFAEPLCTNSTATHQDVQQQWRPPGNGLTTYCFQGGSDFSQWQGGPYSSNTSCAMLSPQCFNMEDSMLEYQLLTASLNISYSVLSPSRNGTQFGQIAVRLALSKGRSKGKVRRKYTERVRKNVEAFEMWVWRCEISHTFILLGMKIFII